MRVLIYLILISTLLSCKPTKLIITPIAKKITEFPIYILTGGTVLLKAQLDNFSDTLNFVLDTGSGGISLDSTTVDYLKLERTKTNKIIRGIAGIKNVDFIFKRSLNLKGLKVDSLDFHVNDYNILTSAYGVKIDGVIGLSLLRRYLFKINYDDLKIEIFTPGNISYPSNGYILKPMFNTLPIIKSTVEDNTNTNGSFIFDTGAGLNMLFNETYIIDSAVINKKRKKFITQAEGLGGKKMMNTTVLRKMTIGPYTFKWVPIYTFSDDFNVTNYPKMGGIIGNDILRRFNLIINYPNKEIFIKPNSHYFDDFDYSYTGLGLYQINGEIIVEDIVKNSPADKSGFKQNDIILSVENNFTNNMQAYKHALQNAGNSVRIMVIRGENILKLTLEVQHIMQ